MQLQHQHQRVEQPGQHQQQHQQQQQNQQGLQQVAPVSIEAVYDAAKTYRAGMDLAPLVSSLKLR
jgi:hypothetical protein